MKRGTGIITLRCYFQIQMLENDAEEQHGSPSLSLIKVEYEN